MTTEPRKTVWIDLSRGTALRGDGPALRLDAPGRAPCWVPWHRLGLLVIDGKGQLPTTLLADAARYGVRIRFVAGRKTVCDLEPAEAIVDPLDAQLDQLLDVVGWRRSWRAWRLRQTLWASARTFGHPVHLGRALKGLHPLSLCALFGLPHVAARDALLDIHGAISLDVRILLRDAGWSSVRIGRRCPGPAVATHLRRMLAFEAVRRWRDGIPVEPSRWYALHRSEFMARGRASLDGVLRWLADITGQR